LPARRETGGTEPFKFGESYGLRALANPEPSPAAPGRCRGQTDGAFAAAAAWSRDGPDRKPFGGRESGGGRKGGAASSILAGGTSNPDARSPLPPAFGHRTGAQAAGAHVTERQSSYSREELLACARGEMFGRENAQLPTPPMLMFDRISSISETGGKHGAGTVVAEMDVRPDAWFFGCHFIGDPVMPGCLGLDALWQMTGFFLGWLGERGRGRALGVEGVKFAGMVTPAAKLVRYVVDMRRVRRGRLALGIADGELFADGESTFSVTGMRVGLFRPQPQPAG